jgi:hypothetical protein
MTRPTLSTCVSNFGLRAIPVQEDVTPNSSLTFIAQTMEDSNLYSTQQIEDKNFESPPKTGFLGLNYGNWKTMFSRKNKFQIQKHFKDSSFYGLGSCGSKN